MDRRGAAIVLLAGLVLLGGWRAAAHRGIRIAVGPAGQQTRPAAAPPAREAGTAGAPAGALRVRCGRRDPPLEPWASVPLSEPVDRLLPDPRGLLAVTDAGLWRIESPGNVRRPRAGAAWTLVLGGGRDYVLRADTILRLSGDSLELFRRRPGHPPERFRQVPAGSGDRSIAVRDAEVLHHSATYRNNYLLVRRRVLDGRILGYGIKVERDFERLFLRDFEALLSVTSLVRADPVSGWAALVPLVGGPIRLIDPRGSIREVTTWAGQRGRVETVARQIVRELPACPTCRREIRETTSHRYQRVYADAAFAEGSLWVLGSLAPGSTEAVVYRIPLEPAAGWAPFGIRLAGLRTAPRAIGIAGDALLAASEDRLYWFRRPGPRRAHKPKEAHCGETDSLRPPRHGGDLELPGGRRGNPGRP